MASDEKRIEHRQLEAGVDHVQAGKPITTPEENARHERQQKLDQSKSFRLTTDKNNSFTLDMGDGKQVKDSRTVSSHESSPQSHRETFRLENIDPSDCVIGPNSLPPGLRPGDDQSFRIPDNIIRPTEFPIGPDGKDPALRPEAPEQLISATEVFAKMYDAFSISVDADGKTSVKEHIDNQPDALVDYAQEKMIGGKSYYELQNGMQVVVQGDSVIIGEKRHAAETTSAVFAALQAAEKLPVREDSSDDSSNPAVTNTERLWYGRPEQQGRQLAEEILRGDFQAFNRDRNVEKFHFTPDQLKTLQHTFQQVIAEQQFNAVHVLNCTPEEATQRLHHIGKALTDGLINTQQAKGIKEKYEQLEGNWNHITNDS